MPTAPLEIPLGLISSFNIYHLMTIDSPTKDFPFHLHVSNGHGSRDDEVDKTVGPGAVEVNVSAGGEKAQAFAERPSTTSPETFTFTPDQLGALASIIRAKNSGPFEVTFDVIFSEQSVYHRVKDSDILTRSNIAALYNLKDADVTTAMWWPQALAFKATVVRSAVSGGWGEVDMHSSTQHVKLMHLEVPNNLKVRSRAQRAGIMMRATLWVGVPRTRCLVLAAMTCAIVTVLFRGWGLARRSLRRRA